MTHLESIGGDTGQGLTQWAADAQVRKGGGYSLTRLGSISRKRRPAARQWRHDKNFPPPPTPTLGI